MQTRDLSAQVGVLRLEVRPRRSMAAIAALSPIATRIAASSPIALKPPPMIFIPTGHVASAASTSPGGTGVQSREHPDIERRSSLRDRGRAGGCGHYRRRAESRSSRPLGAPRAGAARRAGGLAGFESCKDVLAASAGQTESTARRTGRFGCSSACCGRPTARAVTGVIGRIGSPRRTASLRLKPEGSISTGGFKDLLAARSLTHWEGKR
jgi:hypothetical protein